MLTNTPEPASEDSYEAVISLMQAYDCSYEDAHRHLQMLGRSAPIQSENMESAQGRDHEEDHEVLGATERVLKFTPKELRVLSGFFSGHLSYFKSPRKLSLCGRAAQGLRTLRKKAKCLKYLNPKRLWRAFRRRQSASYKKITNTDVNMTTMEPAKTSNPQISERWTEIDSDWMDDLQEASDKLTQYLAVHRELVQQVKGLTGEGVKVAVPTLMPMPQSVLPFLFTRDNSADGIAQNVKLSAEKVFRIICLDSQQFNKILDRRNEANFSMAAYNILDELQILGHFSTITDESVAEGELRFKEFLIKNRLFKSILERDLDDLAFTHERELSSSEEEDQETRRKDLEAHQSIIKEQDMLYQSMLSTYTAREEEKEQEGEGDQSTVHLERHKQTIRLSIRDEPSPSPQTIHLIFRTPNGTILSHTLQYVKDWISIQDSIEFQDSSNSFELYHGYPPAPIKSLPNESLGSIFGQQERKVKLIIQQC